MRKKISREVISSIRSTGEFSHLFNSDTKEMDSRIEKNIRNYELQQSVSKSKYNDTRICTTTSEAPYKLALDNNKSGIPSNQKN